MKKIFFSFLVLFPVFGFASLEDLDREQYQVGEDYKKIVSEIPTLTELRLSMEHADSKVINESVKKMRDFFKKYDEFNLRKIDFIFTSVLERARAEAQDEIIFKGEIPKKAAKWLKEMELIYSSYQSSVIYFGTEKDMERLDYGQRMLPAYGEFAKALRKGRGERPQRNFGSGKIVPFVDSPSDFLKVSGQFIKLIWNAYFRARTGLPDRAPIPEALAGAQRKLVKMRNIETKWEGLSNIEGIEHDGKTLNMFLINHANSFFDTSAQQDFPVKGMSSMGNVDVFFPPFLARRMVKSDHMITIGHGDTTQKTIDLVRRKQLNRFFLAIEGITGTGLYEMRPVMPLFSFAVYDSISRGLSLKLYPVAFPDNFRLMNDWRSPIEGKKAARGIVFPPLTSEMCIHLKRLTGSEDSISHVIRWNWFSALNNSSEEVLSMPFPSEIMKRIDKMVWDF
jgi:hypothetical protein